MGIAAPKIDEQSFNQIYDLVDENQWLRRYRGELVSLWNLCDANEQRDLLAELIERFTVLGPEEISDVCLNIVSKTEEWEVDASNTFFVATADGNVDGSVAGLQRLKNHFSSESGWGESNLLPNIVTAAREVEGDTNIIIFDDFVGTGKTIARKARWFKAEVEKRGVELSSLRACSFAAMKFGIDYFTETSGLELFSPVELEKGISAFNNEEIADQKKQLMRQLEEKLKSKYKGLKLRDHSLGYGESESLYNLREENCSNNVFPIFWWPELKGGDSRKTLLRRAR